MEGRLVEFRGGTQSLSSERACPERAPKRVKNLILVILMAISFFACDSGGAFAPTISVAVNGLTISQGGTHVMTGVTEGELGAEDVFTIKNDGLADLTLLSQVPVGISGENSLDFEITVQPDPLIPSGGSTTFKIRFCPQSAGSGKTATLSIASNAGDSSFSFIVLADAGARSPRPYILVKNDTVEIANDGSIDFGSIPTATFKDIILTIENSGQLPLSLTGTPNLVTISGTGAEKFLVQSQPSASVQPGESTTATIRFSPGEAAGSFNAVIAIPCNVDSTPLYTINLAATSIGSQISVKQGQASIASSVLFDCGDITYSIADVKLNLDFVVENSAATGGAPLVLGGSSPYITISGTNASLATISSPPSSIVDAGGSTTFTVELSRNSTIGDYFATLSIVSNAKNLQTFLLSIKWRRYESKLTVSPSSLSWGSFARDTGMPPNYALFPRKTVTLSNSGNKPLHIVSAMAQQVGAPPVTPFGPTLNISNLDIPAGDSEDVELYFDISLPTAAYTSSIIFNADADNVPFIEVSATGTIE